MMNIKLLAVVTPRSIYHYVGKQFFKMRVEKLESNGILPFLNYNYSVSFKVKGGKVFGEL